MDLDTDRYRYLSINEGRLQREEGSFGGNNHVAYLSIKMNLIIHFKYVQCVTHK